MKTRPMLFSRLMVLALLAGRKTQTRRLSFEGQPGDLIWVKEAWRTMVSLDKVPPRDLWSPTEERGAGIHFEAGGNGYIARGLSDAPRFLQVQDDIEPGPWHGRLRSSMHMPMAFSRLTLRVVDVREEPLQRISWDDAIAEGLEQVWNDHPQFGGPPWLYTFGDEERFKDPRFAYERLWRQINGEASWDRNPTVKVIRFDVLRENVLGVLHGVTPAGQSAARLAGDPGPRAGSSGPR